MIRIFCIIQSLQLFLSVSLFLYLQVRATMSLYSGGWYTLENVQGPLIIIVSTYIQILHEIHGENGSNRILIMISLTDEFIKSRLYKNKRGRVSSAFCTRSRSKYRYDPSTVRRRQRHQIPRSLIKIQRHHKFE